MGRKKKDKIEIWTPFKGLPRVIPIKEAYHFIPSWFKKTPPWCDEQTEHYGTIDKGTIKRCPGVSELMSLGFVIPLWCDLQIQIFDNGSFTWKTPDPRFRCADHSSKQLTDYLPLDAKPTLILKPECPWYIKTPPGISMLQLPMFWHFNPNFTVAAGILWTDLHYSINQQIMFHKKGEILLKRGTPLAQYIPIRREKIPFQVGEETDELKLAREESHWHIRTKFRGGFFGTEKKTRSKMSLLKACI